MCGISGLVYTDPQRPVERAVLERMNAAIRHRGPDSDGFYIRPQIGLAMRRLAIVDLVRIMEASLLDGMLSRQTAPIIGPEEMVLSEAVRRVAAALGKRPLFLRVPVFFHCMLGYLLDRIMAVPLVSLAQVRILSEGIVDPAPPCEPLPKDLMPRIPFSETQIRQGLPEKGRFGLKDLRWFA